jgi:hypothetical protein
LLKSGVKDIGIRGIGSYYIIIKCVVEIPSSELLPTDGFAISSESFMSEENNMFIE